METTALVPMRREHIPSVVHTHLQSFPNFFLSFLGSRFLNVYYTGICAATEGIAFVSLDEEGNCVAFVAGSSNPRGFYLRLLKRDWLRFLFASLGPMLRKPSVIVRVARGLSHPASNPVGVDVAGLFSIGVQPALQRGGAGKLLVQEYLSEARRRGCKRVFLTTDSDGNDSVNAFYCKLGFKVEREYQTPEGRRMKEYWINLSEDASL